MKLSRFIKSVMNITITYRQPILILFIFIAGFFTLFYLTLSGQMEALGRAEALKTQDIYKLCQNRPLLVDKENREVRVLAQMQARAFSDPSYGSMTGYHLVVYRGGASWRTALFVAYVDDADFHDALVSIGAVPGNNLSEAAWQERYNPDSTAPDQHIQGTPIEILACWPGIKKPIPITDLINDQGEGKGLHFRFGGNKSIIPVWKSGCIACLYSCPGGKVGNEAYTIRDYVKNTTRFTLKENLIPQKTTPAMLIFRIKE
jgi:hypothetical protein